MALVTADAAISGAWAIVYTCPDGQTARVTQLQLVGVGTPSATVDVRRTSGTVSRYLVKSLIVPEGVAVSAITGELHLSAGDTVDVRADRADVAEVVFSAELI